MSYRRNLQSKVPKGNMRVDPQSGDRVFNEQIPLPIEMVYNSFTDAVTNVNDHTEEKSYYHNGDNHFNRIYF